MAYWASFQGTETRRNSDGCGINSGVQIRPALKPTIYAALSKSPYLSDPSCPHEYGIVVMKVLYHFWKYLSRNNYLSKVPLFLSKQSENKAIPL